MNISKIDPDILRWDLHLLQPAFFNNNNNNINNNNNNNNNNNDKDQISETENMEDQNAKLVENDEVIAYTLQEELTQLAMSESSGMSDQKELYPELDASSCTPETDEMEISSCLSIEHTDELDGVVGKRLNQMVPVPHVPRIINNIPSFDEAMTDHERLLERLKVYDLVELKVQGDGNCQFRALSDQFYRTPEHHAFVREEVVNQLKAQPEIYKGYVPMGYDEYINKMSKSGEWGDHVTLQAAADSYGVKIFILTSFKDTCYIEILPVVEKSKRIIFLSFWAEVHYNSIYPEAEFPIEQLKKKKKWWHHFV